MRPEWNPNPDKVEPEEVVGRRAFGECFAGKSARIPEKYFRLEVFYEKRGDHNLSLDRLGIRQAQPEVITYLHPFCVQHAEARHDPFTCWAAIRMDLITRDTVLPTLDEEEPGNYFHAELILDAYRAPEAAEGLAFKLSCVAKRVFPSSGATDPQPAGPNQP
jgi:hypothetical protein